MLQNGVPQFVGFCRCTPCRQRRGKAMNEDAYYDRLLMHPVQAAPRQSVRARGQDHLPGMHPVQAAPRQRSASSALTSSSVDAPRAGSAEAKLSNGKCALAHGRCTPCRQRRGKVRGHAHIPRHVVDAPRAGSAEAKISPLVRNGQRAVMHPVQAAPRQSGRCRSARRFSWDAPRAGSAEAKRNQEPQPRTAF